MGISTEVCYLGVSGLHELFSPLLLDLPIYTIIGSRIAAHTAVGTGPYSTVITARTLEDCEQSFH